ncbi:hypothetical protein GW17_00017784 [Ensete ventricosum]|nr:hypothetical protein GW17_00017784 [Ensete ventricosum]
MGTQSDGHQPSLKIPKHMYPIHDIGACCPNRYEGRGDGDRGERKGAGGGRRGGVGSKKKFVSRSVKVGLQFLVGRIGRYL